MSISDISNVLSRIQEQVEQLEGRMLSGSTSAQTGGAALVGGDFSDALAQATGADASSAMTEPTAVAASAGTTLGSLDGAGSALDDAGSGASLPGSTSTLLTSPPAAVRFDAVRRHRPESERGERLVAVRGARRGHAVASGRRQQRLLNIGYTDSGTYGVDDSVWSDPVTAANATAQWLQGQGSVSGYGTSSPGIQSILQSVGQAPTAQVAAIQQSGWSSSGYPNLGSLYAQVAEA